MKYGEMKAAPTSVLVATYNKMVEQARTFKCIARANGNTGSRRQVYLDELQRRACSGEPEILAQLNH